MRKNLLIVLISFASCFAYGQKSELENEMDSITKNWDYRVYKETEKLKIIEYYPSFTRCGRALVYAMAICFSPTGETIRVIESCPGPKKFGHDEIVEFEPDQSIPKDKNPHLTYIDGELNPFLKQYKEVTVTTYGKLKSQK